MSFLIFIINKSGLKPSDYILSLSIAAISLFFLVQYGWSFYATVTDRPGLWGTMHIYYHLSATGYTVISLSLGILSAISLFLPLYFLFQSNRNKLIQSYKIFLFYLSIII